MEVIAINIENFPFPFDIPFDTKRLVRISFYPFKIGLVIISHQLRYRFFGAPSCQGLHKWLQPLDHRWWSRRCSRAWAEVWSQPKKNMGTHGKSWKLMGNHEEIMRKSWEKHEENPWKIHGKSMEDVGKTMPFLPWPIMGISWGKWEKYMFFFGKPP